MRTLSYRVVLSPDDNGTVLVTCPDLPEVTTFGDDREEALLRAVDAIEEALAARIARREPIKAPSAMRGHLVVLPALTALKVELYRTVLKQGVRKAELARRLDVHAPQVDRLLDLRHDSRLEQLEAAFRVLGRRLVVGVEKAA